MSEERILYPLSAAQKLHYFTLKYCPQKQVLNIGTSLTIETDIDFVVLKESIYEAYERSECMRIRFCEDANGEVKQYIHPKEDRDIPYFEFRHWKMEDAEEEMKRWTKVPFERYHSPMNKIVMISMPDGFQGVYLLVDHMTLDAQGLVGFLKDIILIYCAKKYHEEYPKALTSYIQVLEKDLKYEADSKAQQRDRDYWTSYVNKSEPMYSDLMGRPILEEQRKANQNPAQRAAIHDDGSCEADIAQFHLEPDPSDKLTKFCSEHNVPMVCLLLMAIRTYLQKLNGGQSDISIHSTVARRATLLEKNCGGTRIHYFPCRTVVDSGETWLEGCRKIQENQNEMFHHANFNPIEYMMMRSKTYQLKPGMNYEPLSLTYQPLSLRSNDVVPDIRYKTNWYSNGVAAQPLYLTVMHRSLDNGLDFCFEFKKSRYTQKNLQDLYYFLTRVLFYGVEHPQSTVAEIMANT